MKFNQLKNVFAVALLLLVSCDNQSITEENENFFAFENEKVEIAKMFIGNCEVSPYNSPEGTKFVQFSLCSEGANIWTEVSGFGYAVSFFIFNSECLTNTEYSYTYNLDENNENTFFGIYFIDAIIEDGGESAFKSGTLSLTKNNNIYEVSFECITQDNKILKGFYKGGVSN